MIKEDQGGFPLVEEPTSKRESMNVEKARQISKEKIEQLARELDGGRSETLKAYLAAMAKLPIYSPRNVLLIMTQHPGAQRCAGLKTWNRLGRHVRKGEHGILILAPCVRRPPQKAELASADPGLLDEHPESNVSGFRGVYVFDISQTDGAPVAEFACVAGNPGPYAERLKAFVAGRGIALAYSRRIAPACGACIGDTIVLLPDLSPAEQLSTLAHELGHQLLHRSDGHEPRARTVRETEAEAVAYVVCQAIGLDTTTASRDYIHLYQGTVATLAESLERIQHAASAIIAAIGPDI